MSENNSITFFIDDLPECIIPMDSKDTNSKFISSLLYKPILRQINGELLSAYIEDNSCEGLINLKFLGEKFWSDETCLTAMDFYQTIKHIFSKRKSCYYYLDFIKGAKDYIYNDANIENIEMWVQSNTFYAKTISMDTYKDIFSGINFAPLKFKDGKVNNRITSGGYYCISMDNRKLKLRKNTLTKEFPDIIEVIEETSIEKQIQQIEAGVDAYTGFTSLNFDRLLLNKERYEVSSNINFRLVFDTILYEQLKNSIIKEDIINELSQLNGLSQFIEIKKDFKNVSTKEPYKKKARRHVRLLYPRYFPNELIVSCITRVMEKYNLIVDSTALSFKDYLDENWTDYNLVLELVDPITKNQLDEFIEQIKFIDQENKAKYVKLINEYIVSKESNKQEKIDEITDIIQENSRVLNIGIFRQYYIKSSKLPEIVTTDNGLINIEKMFPKE